MKKVSVTLFALVLAAALFVAGALVARENRAQPVVSNPDVICGPSFCAKLVPVRPHISKSVTPHVGSS